MAQLILRSCEPATLQSQMRQCHVIQIIIYVLYEERKKEYLIDKHPIRSELLPPNAIYQRVSSWAWEVKARVVRVLQAQVQLNQEQDYSGHPPR